MLVAFILAAGLSACGFTLRDGDTLHPGNSDNRGIAGLGTLVLDSDRANSDLTQLLRRSLEAASFEIVPATGATPDSGTTGDETPGEVKPGETTPGETTLDKETPQLLLRNERSENRPVAINPRGRAAQYEIRLSVEISLSQNEKELLSTQSLWVTGTYYEDIANIAGTQDEVELLTSELRQELVNQILRLLGRLQSGDVQ